MLEQIFVIGYIVAIIILIGNAYIMIVSGFKSFFHVLIHDIYQITGREKSIFYKINSYTLIVSALLAPFVLLVYPLIQHLFTEWMETTSNFLLHVTAFLIYTGAMLGGFYQVILIIKDIWKSIKNKKKTK